MIMGKAFALMEKVVLISGAKRGALYDLLNGAVYSVDERSRTFLLACKNARSLSDIFSSAPQFSPIQCMAYLDKLVANGLGSYCDVGEVSEEVSLSTASAGLEFAWLEVTAGCNLRCVHCYEQGCPSMIGSEKMQVADWRRIIDELSSLGCKKLQFIGGEPLLLGEDLISLIEYARGACFIFIEVFTNATLLTEKFISAFLANDVHVAISFYGERPQTHELVTLSHGSHKKTLEGIKRIINAGCELRVAVIGMRQNESECERTIAYLKEIGVKHVQFDVVRPSGRGTSVDVVSETLLRSVLQNKPTFPPCTEDTFLRRVRGHNCFLPRICVSSNGEVYPCIMERRVSYGNILLRSLPSVLSGNVATSTQGLSKDKITTCRDCEYRYACSDCRPKAAGEEENSFFAKPKECLYDPYSGTWGSATSL